MSWGRMDGWKEMRWTTALGWVSTWRGSGRTVRWHGHGGRNGGEFLLHTEWLTSTNLSESTEQEREREHGYSPPRVCVCAWACLKRLLPAKHWVHFDRLIFNRGGTDWALITLNDRMYRNLIFIILVVPKPEDQDSNRDHRVIRRKPETINTTGRQISKTWNTNRIHLL